MLPVCGGVRGCPHCWPLLARGAGPGVRDPFRKLLAAAGQAGGAYFLIATAKTARGDPNAPENGALWRQVVERDPKIIGAWEALRAIARRKRDADRFIEAARQVAILRGDSASDWMQLARAYRSACLRPERFAEARAAVRKARELDPGEPSLRWEAQRETDWPPPDDTFDQVSFGSFVGHYYGPSHSFDGW